MPASATLPHGLFASDAHTVRCAWCQATPAYQHYHDHEWGFPVADDRRLFEKICLEGFQAGLSWLTNLNKREAFRRAFCEFDMDRLATFDAADVTRCGKDLFVQHGFTTNLKGVDWLKHHPLAVVVAVASVVVARPQRAWRWARRGFFVWRGWQAIRNKLVGVR